MTTQTFAPCAGPTARNRRRQRPHTPKLRLRSSGLSDVGYERPRNEDRFDADDHRRAYVLADGIGSYKHGNVAAQIAVESIFESVRRDPGSVDSLEPAIRYAHSQICEASRRDPSLERMGTTVVGLLFDDSGSAVVAHAGDSRAYRWRGGELELLTRDHTFAAEMVARGHLREADADKGPWANVLTRALSPQAPLEIETSTTSVRDGDAFLLCSDGLTKMLSDSDIRDCLAAGGGPEVACCRLIEEALLRGGEDNVTVVLIEARTPEKSQDDEVQTATIELLTVPASGLTSLPGAHAPG